MTRTELTNRQREVLLRAVEEGYYAWPRRVTLTQLAARIGVAKSTLSELLMIIESVVMNARARTLDPDVTSHPSG